MMQADIEITAIPRVHGELAAQADYVVDVTFKNNGRAQADVPDLREGPYTWALKRADGKIEKKTFSRPVQPGTPNFEPSTYPLAPGEAVTWNLEPCRLFSPLLPGKHSVQLIIATPPISFTSNWSDFNVAPTKVAWASLAPAREGETEQVIICWRDDGGTRPRILHRGLYVGTQRPEIAYHTVAVGEGDSTSEPIPATSQAGPTIGSTWVGWVKGASLQLAEFISDKPSEHGAALPAGNWRLATLAYLEKPGDEAHARLSGLLIDGKTSQVLGFEWAGGQIAWAPALSVDGQILAARLLQVSDTRRVALIVRKTQDKLLVEAREWPVGKSIAAGKTAASLPAVNAFQSFDARALGSKAAWALVTQDGGKFAVLTGSVNAGGMPHGGPAPWASPASSNVSVTVRLSPAGKPWLLRQTAQGLEIQSTDHAASKVGVPARARFADLYFRNGEHPKVSYLDLASGFATVAAIPDSGADNSAQDAR